MNVAVYPGSFDPFTRGHEEIVRKALPLFDKIHVAVGVNTDKRCLFSEEKRINWIKKCFVDEPKVEVCTYEGLTIDLCRKLGARTMIRGLRNIMDFQYEQDVAIANSKLCSEINTIFFLSSPELAHVSSSMVRELYRYHADCSSYVSYNLFE